MSIVRTKTESDLPDYITQYQQSLTVDETQQTDLINNYGVLESVSDMTGLNESLKNNYMLLFALRDPKKYIQLRLEFLEQLKTSVNNHFTTVYNQVKITNGPKQSKEIALKSAREFQELELNRLEQMYPSSFAQTAYNNQIKKQLAEQKVSLSS